ncbi:MAG: Flp pilus assembly protein CpaB [Gemmatimonas sp.]
MRARSLVFLVLAVGTAALAALFARSWMNAQQAALKPAAPAPVAATEVLVARKPIASGLFVKPEDLAWQPWPEGSLPAGYVVKSKGGSVDAFVGGIVKVGLAAGEPITESRIVKPGDRGFLAAVLQPGMRAVAVSVNATTGVSGFVLPGDHVDVLVTHALQGQGSEKRTVNATETVVEDLRVIAVDQTTSDQSTGAVMAKTVTLEASPKQAEILSLIAQIGKISLSLRSLAVAQDSRGAKPSEPRRTYTVDSEASALLSQGAALVQVVRGPKVKMEGGQSASSSRTDAGESPAGDSDPAIETSAAEAAAVAGLQ